MNKESMLQRLKKDFLGKETHPASPAASKHARKISKQHCEFENFPAYEYSGCTRLVDWIDQEIHQSRKIVYYDHKDRPLKELRFHDYKQYAGKYWRPGRTEMTNLQNGNVSTVDWQDYRFGTNLTDRDFALTRLERVSR